MEKPTSLAGRGRLRETVDLDGSSFLNNSSLDRLRATIIARRFALPMPLAGLVASLALGSANG